MNFYDMHLLYQKCLKDIKLPSLTAKIRIENHFFHIDEPCFYEFRTLNKSYFTSYFILADKQYDPSSHMLRRFSIRKIALNDNLPIYIIHKDCLCPLCGVYLNSNGEYVYGSYISPKTLISSYNNDPQIAFRKWSYYFLNNKMEGFDQMLRLAKINEKEKLELEQLSK